MPLDPSLPAHQPGADAFVVASPATELALSAAFAGTTGQHPVPTIRWVSPEDAQDRTDAHPSSAVRRARPNPHPTRHPTVPAASQ